MRIETTCLHAGYTPENGQPHTLPIYQSTTYRYDSAEHVGQLFDLSVAGHMYSRISNPTVDAVEQKIAAMEGGIGALCTTSGQSAILVAILNILGAGDHFVSTATIYGGAINLFAVTLKKLGIEVSFVDAEASPEEVAKIIRPNTKAIFGETLANPALTVLDIEKWAGIAHSHGVPLIVDNTFPTPVLCNPFQYGADIIVHSTSKYMDGHATVIGGAIVDSGNFNWAASDKFEGLTTPDPSYHGLVYTEAFGKQAYITKARVQLMRDFGVYPQAQDAFILNLGLETLPLRIERHSSNALAVAKLLEASDKIAFVNYPGLASSAHNERANKYLPKGCSGVISFSVKGGRKNAVKLIDSLKLACTVVHVADARTCVLHPASSTHRQLSDDQLVAAGIDQGMIRFSCGIEHIEDILADVTQALAQV